METFDYNYQQIQIPYYLPIPQNPINGIKEKHIQQYNISPEYYPNIETQAYPLNTDELFLPNNIYENNQTVNINNPIENNNINNIYLLNNKQNKKIPKDGNIVKTPKDNTKRKKIIKNKFALKNEKLNKIHNVHVVINENELYDDNNNNKNNNEKQPIDNYKKYNNDVGKLQTTKWNKNFNMKIRTDDINSKDNNPYHFNYLKTTENNLYEYNPKIKTVKKNSLKTIDRIKKNNLISISDAHMNKKNENIKQSNSNNKSINKPKISNKSNNKQKINKKKSITNKEPNKSKILNKNLSTYRINKKRDSNFCVIINKKKLEMFSSFKNLHNKTKNTIEENKNENKSSKFKEKMKKIINLEKNYGRLYSPQLTNPNYINNTKSPKEILKTREKLKNKSINTKIKKTLNRNVSYNIDTNCSIEKKNNFNNNNNKASSSRIFPNKKSDISQKKNFFKGKKSIDLTQEKKPKNIIKKQYSLRLSKPNENEEIKNKYNINTYTLTGKTRKKMIYSRINNDSEFKNVVTNQKKKFFSFMKKIHNNNKYRGDSLLEEKNDMNNKTYKGFSTSKKLEEIKKKYKFYPHSKEKKSLLKDKNKIIDYIGESNIRSRLKYSMNLMELEKEDEIQKFNLTELIPQNTFNSNKEEENPFIKNEDKNTKEKKVSKIIEKDEESIEDNEKNENNEGNDNDVLNHKSFILDLNNIIPINEKKLRDTIGESQLTNSNNNIKKIIKKSDK